MGVDNLRQRLESLQASAHPGQIVQAIFDQLDQDLPEDGRDLLEAWLMGYATHQDCDTDRVALYWKSFLYDESFLLSMKAMNRLFLLSSYNALAQNILREFLGEEPTTESLKRKHLDRFNQAQGGRK